MGDKEKKKILGPENQDLYMLGQQDKETNLALITFAIRQLNYLQQPFIEIRRLLSENISKVSPEQFSLILKEIAMEWSAVELRLEKVTKNFEKLETKMGKNQYLVGLVRSLKALTPSLTEKLREEDFLERKISSLRKVESAYSQLVHFICLLNLEQSKIKGPQMVTAVLSIITIEEVTAPHLAFLKQTYDHQFMIEDRVREFRASLFRLIASLQFSFIKCTENLVSADLEFRKIIFEEIKGRWEKSQQQIGKLHPDLYILLEQFPVLNTPELKQAWYSVLALRDLSLADDIGDKKNVNLLNLALRAVMAFENRLSGATQDAEFRQVQPTATSFEKAMRNS